jgi:hypothetical protein
LEDVFSRDTWLAAVREAYPDVDLDFTPEEESLAGVVDQVTALFERKGLDRFEKWRPDAVLRDRILEAPDAVAPEVLRVAAELNTRLNQLFTKTGRGTTPRVSRSRSSETERDRRRQQRQMGGRPSRRGNSTTSP